MRHVILASHHRFAEGLADTLEFLGNDASTEYICAYVDDEPLAPQVEAAFASFDPEDEVLVLTDILQGSVNQAFAPYIGPKVFLVAGVNVALALELCLAPEPLDVEAIEQTIELGRQSIRLVNTIQIVDDEDDE